MSHSRSDPCHHLSQLPHGAPGVQDGASDTSRCLLSWALLGPGCGMHVRCSALGEISVSKLVQGLARGPGSVSKWQCFHVCLTPGEVGRCHQPSFFGLTFF